MNARRVTVFKDVAGQWRYTVQANNWRTIEASEEGFVRKATVLRRVEAKFPGVEVIVEP